MNKPYVKQCDDNGNIVNPIEDGYYSYSPNRRTRRAHKNIPPFLGCGKQHALLVGRTFKLKKIRQVISLPDGETKIIERYQ